MQIGIVEDAADSLALFSLVLRQEFEKYAVTSFLSGEDFLQIFEPSKFDLVLLDLSLPGISGYDVLRRVRLLDPVIPVLAITAHVFPEHKRQAHAAGFAAVITKPVVDFDRFCDTIRGFLENHNEKTA